MTSEPFPAPAEQEVRNQEINAWLRPPQEWKMLAWPVIAALLAATCNFLGYVSDSGERAALGIYDLNRPTISEGYVVSGATVLARLVLGVLFTLIVAYGLRASGRRIVRRLPSGMWVHVSAVRKRPGWGWLFVTAAVAASGFWSKVTSDLERGADYMILKSAKEIGTAWLRMSIDRDLTWQAGYTLLLAAGIAIFAALSWWILTRFFTSAAARAVYGTWAMLQLFLLVGGFSFVLGAMSTVRPYPVVSFSNMYQLLEEGTVPVLVGSDDKVYALLLILKVGPRKETPDLSKAILYLPRTEVKWMAVVRQVPLHAVALYHDWKRLLPVAPTNPEPTRHTPSPGVPTRNTPDIAPGKSIRVRDIEVGIKRQQPLPPVDIK